MTNAPNAIQVHNSDNVAVALQDITAGEHLLLPGHSVLATGHIQAGHKIALEEIATGASLRKFGAPFGRATRTIAAGAQVHTHNVSTSLSDTEAYTFEAPDPADFSLLQEPAAPRFKGYRRSDGRVATRNEIWIISTVGCVSRTVDRIARLAQQRFSGQVDGVHAFSHPYGCSQLGDDLEYTQKILAGLINHPNAGGVLVVGLGCETNQVTSLLQHVAGRTSDRIRYFDAQAVTDEVDVGIKAIEQLVQVAKHDQRTTCSLSDLSVGLKCGGSDGFSGLTANPLVGNACDQVTQAGGRAILSEIPEMFGAERQLMRRCTNKTVFARLVSVVNDFKQYFIGHDQPIYENPSPGNIAGGITTLEEKSLGAIQKGGAAPVSAVLRYGEPALEPGLSILEAPGNDGVSSTAMVASGATLLLFTTGRGTPLGFPVPTIKIASNSDIARNKPHWIDFDAGRLLQGARMEAITAELMTKIIDTASGASTCNETNDEREIAIWKKGVTL